MCSVLVAFVIRRDFPHSQQRKIYEEFQLGLGLDSVVRVAVSRNFVDRLRMPTVRSLRPALARAPAVCCGSHSHERRPPLVTVKRPSGDESCVCSRRSWLALGGGISCMCCTSAAHAYSLNADAQRSFAVGMDEGMREYEDGVRRRKVQWLSQGLGDFSRGLRICELGVGTFPNASLYSELNMRNVQVVGVDPNPFMLERARDYAARADVDFVGVQGDDTCLEELTTTSEGKFDAVVCSLVLCSVNDVSATLGRISKSVKPGGRFLFWEHVRGTGLQGIVQDSLSPLQQVVADGCHLNRQTLKTLQSCKTFSVDSAETFLVDGASLIAPHISGFATVIEA